MPALLDPLTDDLLLPLTHGFFTRRGGASSGIFQGLNCGQGSSDQSEAVAVNRARVAHHMGVAPTDLIGVHQVHSADVVTLDASASLPWAVAPRADAIVTDRPGLALTVLTADCQPVLFADRTAGVIGAAHAGWRGALSGVLGNTVRAMVALGARAHRITAVIGPAISPGAYEVDPDFRLAFLADDAGHARFFSPGKGQKLMFDLPAFGLHQLARAGVGQARWTGHCTYGDPAQFYSYRRSFHEHEADYGRQISGIRL